MPPATAAGNPRNSQQSTAVTAGTSGSMPPARTAAGTSASASVPPAAPARTAASLTTAAIGATSGATLICNDADWEQVGVVNEDLSTTGFLDEENSSDSDRDDECRLTEVLQSENLLRQLEDALPTFLNLSFEEVCYQAREDRKVLMLAVVADDSNVDSLARLLSRVANCNNSYFWVALASSKCGKKVKTKFGNSRGSELFVVAPTMAVHNPVLVERYSDDSLKDAGYNVEEAIERGRSAMVSLGHQYERLEEERDLKREQDQRFEAALSDDRLKAKEKCKEAMTERRDRILEEPDTNYWTIRVKVHDGTTKIRNFSKKGTYQEVYDWIGFVTEKPYFTLHKGAGGGICKHNDPLTESQLLHFIVRSESQSTEMLRSEVSFYGNYNPNTSLASTAKDGDEGGNEDEGESTEDEPHKKQKKSNVDPQKQNKSNEDPPIQNKDGDKGEKEDKEESTEGEPNKKQKKSNKDPPIQNEEEKKKTRKRKRRKKTTNKVNDTDTNE